MIKSTQRPNAEMPINAGGTRDWGETIGAEELAALEAGLRELVVPHTLDAEDLTGPG